MSMPWSWSPVQLSLTVAATATLISLLISIPSVYWMTGRKQRRKVLIETLFFMPLVLPPTVIGFLLLVLFGSRSPVGKAIEWLTGGSLLFTVPAAILVATIISFPLIYQTVKTGFLSVNPDIVNSARMDGASEWSILVSMTIPLAFKSILSGMLLGFTRALGEFGATLMIAGNIPGRTQTIPTAIFLAMESGQTKIAWVYASISLAFSFVLLLAINRGK